MKITFDPAKRKKTLEERDLDFADASAVFAGLNYTFEDDRHDYGEVRYITVGLLGARMVILVWTPRTGGRHVISLRKANDRETKKYKGYLG